MDTEALEKVWDDMCAIKVTREEILELVEIARIKALPLAQIEGGGAAFRSILALADSVAALAEFVEVRKTSPAAPLETDPVVIERRQHPGRRQGMLDRRRFGPGQK